ncbi:hypothetical protein HanHA300_Chr10g0376981 [Helianthus annuus]|nr:hypothetical protein HanHA300_Chr10g0376981 [Helianthus annuus]KAJ0523484.1 hypothetical protein HanIR_Chr10g0494351 [Helianthus annuus]KAJ0531288.1 hypothetical protein HanHA89_Chr10g0399471 [Helianthus annuus]KAJ0701495.1 hypothetical protein HanOQP8_Chr10g0379991 [Helianthus annuus]
MILGIWCQLYQDQQTMGFIAQSTYILTSILSYQFFVSLLDLPNQTTDLFSKYLPKDRKERKETNLHYPWINGFWPELNVFRSYTSCHNLPIYLCFLGVSVPVGGGYAGFYGVPAAMRGRG